MVVIDVNPIRERFSAVAPFLDERGRRLVAAAEAFAAGYGGIAAVAAATGMASTIGRGLKELAQDQSSERIGRPGAGRKPTISKRCYGRGERRHYRRCKQPTGCPMPQPNDLSRSLAALDENSTLIAVIEMSQSSWLVAGIVPGVERHPAKKFEPDETALLRLLHRWRQEAEAAGRNIDRITVAFEAGRDGFWLTVGCERTASKRV